MASPTPPLALSPPSLALLQTRSPALPGKEQQPETGAAPTSGQVPATLLTGGRGRLVDILV
jgi:hypothetical protein